MLLTNKGKLFWYIYSSLNSNEEWSDRCTNRLKETKAYNDQHSDHHSVIFIINSNFSFVYWSMQDVTRLPESEQHVGFLCEQPEMAPCIIQGQMLSWLTFKTGKCHINFYCSCFCFVCLKFLCDFKNGSSLLNPVSTLLPTRDIFITSWISYTLI